MADLYSLCLLGVMDRLWFHQIILFSESSAVVVPETLKKQTPFFTESLIDLPSTTSFSLATSPVEVPSVSPPITLELNKDKEEEIQQQKQDNGIDTLKERPTRLNLSASRVRSNSSSPSTDIRGPKGIRNSCLSRKLQKSMSCRRLGELELEEVKGFMDLGFIFKKGHISPKMISVVPGLLRLGLYKNKHIIKLTNSKVHEDDDIHSERDEQLEEEKGVIRSYLSEAWLIKRPNSPLLNLRLPRVSDASDMKKHLKFWARTVASVIQQES